MINNLKAKLKAMATAYPLPELRAKTPRLNASQDRGDFGGTIAVNAYGSHVVKRTVYPADWYYGRVPLASLTAFDPASFLPVVGLEGGAALKELVFLDTETTGLGQGTGTVAFLAGLGRFRPEGLLIEQFLMRDYDEEASMIFGLMEALRGCRLLVTFNGKSFDWPLLQNRMVFSRLRPEQDFDSAHLDLLHLSRRLWGKILESCALGALETHILGHSREGDIPGQAIPGIYQAYLTTCREAEMHAVIQHNEWDIAALAALLARLGHLFSDPEDRADPWELLGISKIYAQNGYRLEAAGAYLACIRKAAGSAPGPEAQMRLAYLLKRGRQFKEAYSLFAALSERSGNLSIAPLIEMAKVLEHRDRDYGQALAHTEQALQLAVSCGLREGDKRLHEIKKRRGRLLSRLERMDGAWGS